MSFNKNNGDCNCERCGHFWECKAFYSQSEKKLIRIEPTSCARCKSKGWNKPRVYGGKYLYGSAPMAKRYKPTGRRAAKLKPELDFYAARGRLYSERDHLRSRLEDYQDSWRKLSIKATEEEEAYIYYQIKDIKEKIENIGKQIEALQEDFYKKRQNEKLRT